MANKIIVVLEQRENIIKKASFEAVSVANDLAGKIGADTEAVIAGNDILNLSDISKYGVSNVTHLKNPDFANYTPSGFCDAISEHAKSVNADYIIIANTSLGKDLAPRLAVRLNAGCIMDITAYNISNDELLLSRPVYAGKAMVNVKFKSDVKVFTTRPNVFKAAQNDAAPAANISVKEISSPNLKSKVTEFKKAEGKLDVAEASIIVSGGRGLKGPENFHLVEELADVLGAAVGASRAVVDAGWRSHGEQVGQTGKTVSPTLYVACGISGAIQHLAGMSSSKYIVAINKDKDAPIFNVADYGIAGDLFEIIPKLTEEIKKIKS